MEPGNEGNRSASIMCNLASDQYLIQDAVKELTNQHTPILILI